MLKRQILSNTPHLDDLILLPILEFVARLHLINILIFAVCCKAKRMRKAVELWRIDLVC
ncbi:hypothetical protein [Bartonella machadoae]|uniref:hypothetical protein n=1 Tax=Bartonella machadoae TaxID=2893471 RepID=UPI001F4CEFBF|nr:hypothetical protein [Bartonella machadoae]UNE54005.1 hypothetical protein LNM86_10650 [Bartonella machadoae]